MKIFYLIMMKKLLMISIALCLTACSSTNAPIEQISAQYNPKTQARVAYTDKTDTLPPYTMA